MNKRKKYLYFLYSGLIVFTAALGVNLAFSQRPSFEISPVPEPTIQDSNSSPLSGLPGTIFTISSLVKDISGIESVIAHIQNPDEVDIAQIALYDDGNHNDELAKDNIFANTFDSTGRLPATYYIDIVATDTLGNFSEQDNEAIFDISLPGEKCDNQIDDDKNGYTDCGDQACSDNPVCLGPLTASIISPKEMSYFEIGDGVFFNALVSGGAPPYNYLWQYARPGNPLTDMGYTQSMTKNDFPLNPYEIYFTVRDSLGQTFTTQFIHIIICEPPTASITAPKDGAVFEALDMIHFAGDFSDCGGANWQWTSSIDGVIGNNVQQLDTRNLSVGVHAITFSVNYLDLGKTATDTINITVSAPPSVKPVIISPKPDDIFASDESINFDSLVTGGSPGYTFSWASNLDGNIGNSQTFLKSGLTPGDHTITLTATDILGAIGRAMVDIHILPDSFDWRNINGGNWMTSVKFQSCDDCMNFAQIGVMEAKYNIQENNPDLDIDLSEQYVLDCCGDFSPFNCPVVEESCSPYQEHSGPNADPCTISCPATCNDGTSYKLWSATGSGLVKAPYGSDYRTILKYTLIQKGPLYIQLSVFSCPKTGSLDKDGCPIRKCGMPINHAEVLVGYDNIGKYWIVKNSWGAQPTNPCADGFDSIDYESVITGGRYIEGIIAPK